MKKGRDYYGVFASCGNVVIDVRHFAASAKLVALLPKLDVKLPKHRDAERRCAEAELDNACLQRLSNEVAVRDAGVDTVYAAPGDARRSRLAAVEEADDDAGAAAAVATPSVHELWRRYFADTEAVVMALDNASRGTSRQPRPRVPARRKGRGHRGV